MYYKIYINESALILASKMLVNEAVFPVQDLVVTFPSKKKFLLNYIDSLEKSTDPKVYVFTGEDADAMLQTLSDCFELMEAAGGLVFNEGGELLSIFRRGFWDLPKGKIDPGEDAETAAAREITEETGVGDLRLVRKIGETRHVYRMGKGRRILKRSIWYHFETQKQELIPQTEEDIEKAVWSDFASFKLAEPSYASIRDICQQFTETGA